MERDARHYATYCGCDVGSAFLFAALVVCAVVAFRRPGGIGSLSLLEVGYGLALCLGAAVLGKGVGLAYGRIRFRMATRALSKHLATDSARHGPADIQVQGVSHG